MSELLSDYRPVWHRPRWWIVAAVAVSLLLGCWWGISVHQARERARQEAYERAQPQYVVRVLDYLTANPAVNFSQYEGYFTPKGVTVWKWMSSVTQNDVPHTQNKSTMGNPVVNGVNCDISVTGSDGSVFYFRLTKGVDNWLFDDIYFDVMDGKKVGIWASYMHDHPYMTMLKMNWADLLKSFLQGVAIGSGAAL